jgi:hypothetical protein
VRSAGPIAKSASEYRPIALVPWYLVHVVDRSDEFCTGWNVCRSRMGWADPVQSAMSWPSRLPCRCFTFVCGTEAHE